MLQIGNLRPRLTIGADFRQGLLRSLRGVLSLAASRAAVLMPLSTNPETQSERLSVSGASRNISLAANGGMVLLCRSTVLAARVADAQLAVHVVVGACAIRTSD